jgi:2,3-bisphosphoglycerate-independent phosphoglycerate mutase
MKHPTALVVLDGCGYRQDTTYNAVAQAHTPTITYLKHHYPQTLIQASGQAVGLLSHAVGNSEVGHLTMGSGRIIDQPIKQMHDKCIEHTLAELPGIKQQFQQCATSGNTIHLMGLLSDAGVHSHIEQLLELITVAHQYHVKHIALHCFLDGRDTLPRSAATYLKQLDEYIAAIPEAFIATLCGRFFAMDRNKEWDRTQKTYDMLIEQQPLQFTNWQQALDYYYAKNITDEFIPPTQISTHATIHDGDGIVFFNCRPDRARQLTQAFVDQQFDKFQVKKIVLQFFITPTRYSPELDTLVLLTPPPVTHTLMDVLAQHHLTTFAIAETEKYAHVTYFFNAGRESTYPTESHVLVPSITAQTYKDIPEMQAPEITQQVLESLENNPHNFYLINYANLDMVGHSGDMQATIKAVECVDSQIKKLYQKIVHDMNGTLYITSDHGKAELMYDVHHNQPYTAHTINPVDFIAVNKTLKDQQIVLPLKGLKDIAPFILRTLKIPVPIEMG